nr:ethylene-responsive transcription factor ERF084-like [Lolium perenne]
MPPRRRSASGYSGVRARPSGRFDAEIRSGEERIRLETFDTAHEAARGYDAPRRQRELEQRLLIAERDERLHLEWARQFPEDVTAMETFYAQKEETKAAAAKKKASREKRRAESAARKAATAEKAARREEEKKRRRDVHHHPLLLLLRVDFDAGVRDYSKQPLVGLRLGFGVGLE